MIDSLARQGKLTITDTSMIVNATVVSKAIAAVGPLRPPAAHPAEEAGGPAVR